MEQHILPLLISKLTQQLVAEGIAKAQVRSKEMRMERFIKIMLNPKIERQNHNESKQPPRYQNQNFNNQKVQGNLCILGGPIGPNEHIQKHLLADYTDQSHVKLKSSLKKKLKNFYSQKSFKLDLEIKNLRLSQESPTTWKRTVEDTSFTVQEKISQKRHSIIDSKRSSSLSDKSYYLQAVPQIPSSNRKQQEVMSDAYYDAFNLHLNNAKAAKSPTINRIFNDPLPIAGDPGRKTHFGGKQNFALFTNPGSNLEFQKRQTDFNSFNAKRPGRQTQNTFFPVTASESENSKPQQNKIYYTQKLHGNKDKMEKISAKSINEISAQKYLNKLRIKQTKVVPQLLNPQISESYTKIKKLENSPQAKSLSATPLKKKCAQTSFLTPLRQRMPNQEITRQKLQEKNNSSILEDLMLKMKAGLRTNPKFASQVLGSKRSSRDLATDQMYFNGQYRVPCKQLSSAKVDVSTLQISQEPTLKPVIQRSAIKTSSRGQLNPNNSIYYPQDNELSSQFKITEATTQPKNSAIKGTEPPVMRRKYPLRRQVTMPKRLPSNQANMLLNEGENQSIITIEQMGDEEERYSDIQPSEKLPSKEE